MSDAYDYGYCDHCDTYHYDVKQAHRKQEPMQPTFEELEEMFQEDRLQNLFGEPKNLSKA